MPVSYESSITFYNRTRLRGGNIEKYGKLTEGELWQIDESLAAAVRGVEGQRLHYVVGLKTSLLHSILHHLHSLHTGHGVKVAVDSHNLGTWRARDSSTLTLGYSQTRLLAESCSCLLL